MKNKKRLGALLLLSLLAVSSVSAKEVNERTLSNFHCLNSTCWAYLEEQRILGTCPNADCGEKYRSYRCPVCKSWFAICDAGHYAHVDGRNYN